MEWPNLPEDYGDGQRQLDMALAANAAAEPIAYFAAIGAAYMAATLINLWLAPVAGIGIYFIFMKPHKQALKVARIAHVKDIEAYHAHIEKQSHNSQPEKTP